MRQNVLLLIVCCVFCVSCKQEKPTPTTDTSTSTISDKSEIFSLPEWAKKSTIYEVNIRQYTQSGTINEFSDHIPRLKDLGVDIIWLMPLFPISETKRKGTLGSYYSISDYKDVDPFYGSKKDLVNLIKKIQAYEMKVILDWVPNHTGWDHNWITNHPDFYTKNEAGEITDPLDDNGKSHGWTDVADLNYDNSEMRDSMMANLMHWVDHGVDGFRMDIAFGVPDDFWVDFRTKALDKNPALFLLAESEEASHLNDDLFHACYGWPMHHLMNDIANGKKQFSDFKQWRKEDSIKYKKGLRMNFITNHDENSWNGSEIERMGLAYQAFAVLVHMMDGIPLIYSGQEEPLEKRLKFFEKDNIGFEQFKAVRFYKDLIRFKKNNPALWNRPYGGEIEEVVDHPSVFAFKRTKEDNSVFVLINVSDQEQKVVFDQDIRLEKDIFTKETINFNKGQEYRFDPWEFVVAKSK